jgi:hypothetical protein
MPAGCSIDYTMGATTLQSARAVWALVAQQEGDQ